MKQIGLIVTLGLLLVAGCDKGKENAPLEKMPSETEAPRELSVTLSDGETKVAFRLLPAGRFVMGSPLEEKNRNKNESPHQITISKPFYMATMEVTQAQWKAVMGTEPWVGKDYVKEGATYPATYVSWEDANEFCQKLSAKIGRKATLPTEAQWEYACRAGSKSVYCFGNSSSELAKYAWYDENAFISKGESEKSPLQVGKKRPNAFGIYDMHGNVSEWCQNKFYEYLADAQVDPSGSKEGYYCVDRGGGWGSSAEETRSAARGRLLPTTRFYQLGFRICLILSK